ncbi:MAG: SH3 domain-containing protein [Clostridia bacterium]|nr:SH3 domain-containing protein [Clostridia bacterium]
MKKLLAMMLALCCLAALMGGAGAAEEKALMPYNAVIANPKVADRLNLRDKPDKKANSLARLYSGTPVTVLDEIQDEKTGDAWAHVQVDQTRRESASLSGYVLKEYLMRKNRNYGAPELFVTADPVSGRVPLRDKPGNSGTQLTFVSDTVYVLGDVGDDWRYVRYNGVYGYVRTNQLTRKTTNIWEAFLCPANGGDKVTLFDDKELKNEKGFLYAGTNVRVRDYTRDGWALVENYGAFSNSELTVSLQGYVRQEDLTVFVQPWAVERRIPTAYALADFTLPHPFETTVPKGAALGVLGEIGGQYWALYAMAGSPEYIYGLVDKTKVHVTDLAGFRKGAQRRGYALLPRETDEDGYAVGTTVYTAPGEAEHETYLRRAQLLAQLENSWLQVRQQGYPSFFVPEAGVQIIEEEDLWVREAAEKTPGAWTAEEQDAGLWLLTVQNGETAKLTLEHEVLEKDETYDVTARQGETVTYTVYIPVGTDVHWTGGGTLTPASRESLPVVSTLQSVAEAQESDALFSGSGRFLCDHQLASDYDYFGYWVKPIDGAEDAWAKVSSLFSTGEDDFTLITDFDDEDRATLELEPGTFIELHNCSLFPNFGNG